MHKVITQHRIGNNIHETHSVVDAGDTTVDSLVITDIKLHQAFHECRLGHQKFLRVAQTYKPSQQLEQLCEYL